MPLSPGDKLGPYEILSPIGAGGMGEVYKANDTRLGRTVALKLSKTAFDQRFEREARAIAALNHPNICTLYDVGPNYLVMECVDGLELKGPLPLAKAIELACQILDALDAAHRKGITHRDLKPANVLVAKSGVKVLDFGLAKMEHRPLPADHAVTALTARGEMAGTLFYMAPEQLQGKEDVDSRADIFSFGCVLYELLTGKRAFDGPNAASVIAAVMERPAPSLAEVAPPALDRLLRKCLAKDPDARWQSARDLKDELQWIASAPATASPTDRPTAPVASAWVWKAVASVLGAVALGAVWMVWRGAGPAAEPKPLVRLDLDLGHDVALSNLVGSNLGLSRDGSRLVYVSNGKLFSRKLDQSKATELAGSEGASTPFFSPDGQWIAFFAGGKLKKMPADGGPQSYLCDAPAGYGGSWGEDGNIVISRTALGPLERISSNGGEPAPVTTLAIGESFHHWPQILPGGRALLMTSSSAAGLNIEAVSSTGARKTLLRGFSARFLETGKGRGYLVYVNNGSLFAVNFDPDALEVRGTPVALLDQVAYDSVFASAEFDASQNGMLVYRSGAANDLVTLDWLDSNGKAQPLPLKPDRYSRPRLSPDGQRLALDIPEASSRDIWIYDLQRDIMTRLTFNAGGVSPNPIWSPDGRFLAFEGKGGMFWTRADGAGTPQPLTRSRSRQVPWSFTPDGTRLAWLESPATVAWQLWSMPIEAGASGLRAGKSEMLFQSPFDSRYPAFSPDGRWLAYTSNESGTYQIYVRAFPDKGGKWQVSSAGGSYAVWSRTGRELFFRSPDNHVMVAGYSVNGDSFASDKPRTWSDRQLINVGLIGSASYDVAPDGKRVLALMPVETPEARQAQNHVVFLVNFIDELRRRVPL